MNEKHKTPKRQNQHLGKIKFAIAAGAVTITMGFWTIFSNQADRTASVQATPEPQVAVDPNSQLILLPMPTLVPQTNLKVAGNPPVVDSPVSNPPAANSTSNTTLNQFVQGQKIMLGGPPPSAPARPQTITRSRSSK